MKEIWKQIPDFPNYECSNLGRIKNIKTNKILRGTNRQTGYSFIDLYNFEEHKRKNAQIHRIVALLFVDNPDNKPYVNHIDGNKTNNIYTNLEWCTPQENTTHAVEVLNINPGGWNKKQVMCVETGVIYESCAAAGKAFNVPDNIINRVANGIRKHHKGFHFKFI